MAAPIQARDLDQLCQLRRRTETPDGMGGATVSYSLISDVWASIRPMRGGERFFAQQLTPNAGYLVTLRNRLDLSEADVLDTPLGRFDLRFIRRQLRDNFVEVEAELQFPTG